MNPTPVFTLWLQNRQEHPWSPLGRLWQSTNPSTAVASLSQETPWWRQLFARKDSTIVPNRQTDQHKLIIWGTLVKLRLIYTRSPASVLGDQRVGGRSLFNSWEVGGVPWLEGCSAEAFWSLDGVTVPLQVENWDGCGIWSGLFAFPGQGKVKGGNVICKARSGSGEISAQQPELGCLVGIQVAAV